MFALPNGWFPRRSPVDSEIVLGDDSPEPPQRPADAHPLAGRYEPPAEDDREPVSLAVPTADFLREHRSEVAAQIELPSCGHDATWWARGEDVGLVCVICGPNGPHEPSPYNGIVGTLTVDPPTRDPGESNRRPDFPQAPDYSRRAYGAVARIDDALDENLRAANQRLRRELTAAIDGRRLVEHERDAALARIAELELTLRALGRVVVHAAGHDEGGA